MIIASLKGVELNSINQSDLTVKIKCTDYRIEY